MPVINANSVDLDQTARSAASDLSLHCSPCHIYGTLRANGLKDLNQSFAELVICLKRRSRSSLLWVCIVCEGMSLGIK